MTSSIGTGKNSLFGVNWEKHPFEDTQTQNLVSSADLAGSWKKLASTVLEAYPNSEFIHDYLAIIERKVAEALKGELDPDNHLMMYANQLEDVLYAMDIEATLSRTPQS